MGNAKRRKNLGTYPELTDERTKLLTGIDRSTAFILNVIGKVQKLGFRNALKIQVTNDIPGSPIEESLGLTSKQIDDLTEWLNANSSRFAAGTTVSVLRVEDCPSHGQLYLLPNWLELMTEIFSKEVA